MNYTIFQSARRIIRRLKAKKMPVQYLDVLRSIRVEEVPLPLTWSEGLGRLGSVREQVLWTIQDCENTEQFAGLLRFCERNARPRDLSDEECLEILQQYHLLHLQLLNTLEGVLGRLCRLRNTFGESGSQDENPNQKAKRLKLPQLVESTRCLLSRLMPFAWTSSFHTWYLREFIGQALMSSASESLPSITANGDPPALEDSEGEVADASADNDSYDEELDEELLVGDAVLPSDFMEACDPNPKAMQVPSWELEWKYWLRLLTVPTYYAVFFHGPGHSVPRSIVPANVTFQVIECAPPSTTMKPWRVVVRDLVPEKEKYDYIIDQLEEQYQLDEKSKFKGAPHCEAILATLHYLAKNSHESSVYPPSHTLRPQGILYSCMWLMFLSVRDRPRSPGEIWRLCCVGRAVQAVVSGVRSNHENAQQNGQER